MNCSSTKTLKWNCCLILEKIRTELEISTKTGSHKEDMLNVAQLSQKSVPLYFSYLLLDGSSEIENLNLSRDLNMKKVLFGWWDIQ